MDLKDKIAVVTGASKGLGTACAKSLIARGAIVYGIARNIGRLHTVRKALGEKFIPVPVDITDETELTKWVSETFSSAHKPSVLINNAGTGHFSTIDTLTSEQWHSMISTNLTGLFYVTRSIVPFMRRQDHNTHVINVGSVLGKTARTEASAYCATKYGLQGFSEALSKELRSDGIKVTCINPGSIATGFFRQSGIAAHANMLQPDDLAALITFIIETPDNFQVDEIMIRPLDPRPPKEALKSRDHE